MSSSLCPRRNNIIPTSSSSSSSSSSSKLILDQRWDLLQVDNNVAEQDMESAIGSKSKDDEKEVGMGKEEGGGGGGGGGDDDDEGYHTPTSPRHRIPRALTCPPPPPRKPTPTVCGKRKARIARACRKLGIEGEVDSFFSAVEGGGGFLRIKKARRETAIAK